MYVLAEDLTAASYTHFDTISGGTNIQKVKTVGMFHGSHMLRSPHLAELLCLLLHVLQLPCSIFKLCHNHRRVARGATTWFDGLPPAAASKPAYDKSMP
jgi:hypothetical protein